MTRVQENEQEDVDVGELIAPLDDPGDDDSESVELDPGVEFDALDESSELDTSEAADHVSSDELTIAKDEGDESDESDEHPSSDMGFDTQALDPLSGDDDEENTTQDLLDLGELPTLETDASAEEPFPASEFSSLLASSAGPRQWAMRQYKEAEVHALGSLRAIATPAGAEALPAGKAGLFYTAGKRLFLVQEGDADLNSITSICAELPHAATELAVTTNGRVLCRTIAGGLWSTTCATNPAPASDIGAQVSVVQHRALGNNRAEQVVSNGDQTWVVLASGKLCKSSDDGATFTEVAGLPPVMYLSEGSPTYAFTRSRKEPLWVERAGLWTAVPTTSLLLSAFQSNLESALRSGSQIRPCSLGAMLVLGDAELGVLVSFDNGMTLRVLDGTDGTSAIWLGPRGKTVSLILAREAAEVEGVELLVCDLDVNAIGDSTPVGSEGQASCSTIELERIAAISAETTLAEGSRGTFDLDELEEPEAEHVRVEAISFDHRSDSLWLAGNFGLKCLRRDPPQ